jgi:hypothetical protein
VVERRRLRMKRGLWALAVGICLAAPSMATADEAAVTETFPVAGDQFVCEDATYSIVSGEVHFILHEGESASGNQNFTITIAPMNVEAVSSATGETVRIVGAFWAGFTANAKTGGFQGTATDHFQIVSAGGGTIDDVQVTSHITFRPPDKFVIKDFDFGTCSSPA